jgi:hypothetical protein
MLPMPSVIITVVQREVRTKITASARLSDFAYVPCDRMLRSIMFASSIDAAWYVLLCTSPLQVLQTIFAWQTHEATLFSIVLSMILLKFNSRVILYWAAKARSSKRTMFDISHMLSSH